MTQFEYEYAAGQKAYSERKPFSSSMSAAWQQGWIDSFEAAEKFVNELIEELQSTN
jgi:hypothetical protein